MNDLGRSEMDLYLEECVFFVANPTGSSDAMPPVDIEMTSHAVSPATLPTLAQRYRDAEPFPHLVIDGLFPEGSLERLNACYDTVNRASWHVQDGPLQSKRRTRHDSALPREAQSYFDYVNSGPFIRLLSSITGIENLLPDPALHGGGMHEVGAGGHFEVHVDFAEHPRTGLDNRLTVITYLNHDWTVQDGGALELWQKAPLCRKAAIVPQFGRTVIFEQSPNALHGHTDPVRQSQVRRAVISYYYTNGRYSGSLENRLSTKYYRRKGQSPIQQLEVLARYWLPPVLMSAAKSVREMMRSRIIGRRG